MPQALILATLGLEAGSGLVGTVWFPILVLSLVVSILAFAALVITIMDAAAHRVTAAPAVSRIFGSAVLALFAPLAVIAVPLLALFGFGRRP